MLPSCPPTTAGSSTRHTGGCVVLRESARQFHAHRRSWQHRAVGTQHSTGWRHCALCTAHTQCTQHTALTHSTKSSTHILCVPARGRCAGCDQHPTRQARLRSPATLSRGSRSRSTCCWGICVDVFLFLFSTTSGPVRASPRKSLFSWHQCVS